jgi:hypothetical protein
MMVELLLGYYSAATSSDNVIDGLFILLTLCLFTYFTNSEKLFE